MIPSREELSAAIFGAWLLARWDERGLGYFDFSVDGFFRSFFAAVIAAPVFIATLIQSYGPVESGVGRVVAAETLNYALQWVLFPIAAIFLTRMLGLSRRYVPLVVASNWAGVLQVALLAFVSFATEFLPVEIGDAVKLASFVAVLVYMWFVFRAALQTTGGTAAGLLVVSVILSFMGSRIGGLAFGV